MMTDEDIRLKGIASDSIRRALDPVASKRLERLLSELEQCPPTLEALLEARSNLIAWRHLIRELTGAAEKAVDVIG